MKQIANIFFGLITLIGVSQAQNVSPQANLDLAPSVVRVGEPLRYDATNSRDGQGQSRNLEYRFQFSNASPFTPFSGIGQGEFIPTQEGDNIFRVEIRDRITGAVQRTFRTYRVSPERNPNPPIIRLLSEPPFSAGEQIGFEVIVLTESSINRNDIQVRWDFNSDGIFDTPFRTDKKGFFAYPGGNLVSPTVEVQFPGGRTLSRRGIRNNDRIRAGFDFDRDIDTLRINPTRIQAPIVDVHPGFIAPNENTVFTFDASRSRLGSSSTLEFFFDGVKRYAGKNIVKHRFQSPGEHVVRVKHCINNGAECRTTEVNIIVTNPSDSTGTGFSADFFANEVITGVKEFQISEQVYQAVQSQMIRFNGQVITTGQRANYEYRWDFNGDGSWDTPFASVLTAEHTYDNHGTFKPKLEIRDDQGNSQTATKTIVVLKNTKPSGRIRTLTWPNYTGHDIQFLVEAIDGQSRSAQLEVRFDFDGDGVWDTEFRRTQSERWRFDAPGNYAVKVQVRDPQREVTTFTRNIPVIDTPKPQVNVKVSHRNQAVGQAITLDATESIGAGLQFEWQNLSDPYAPAIRGEKATLRFDTPGERIICLHVIDQAGNIEEINFPVNITEKTVVVTPGISNPIADLPEGLDAISEFVAPPSEFVWSDTETLSRPRWRLTGMRPGN